MRAAQAKDGRLSTSLVGGPTSTGSPTTQSGLHWTQRADWGLVRKMSLPGSVNKEPAPPDLNKAPNTHPDHSFRHRIPKNRLEIP
jgi:hypothetical protein